MVGVGVQGGTAKQGQDLCRTCANGTVVELENGTVLKECSALALKTQKRVVRCGQYRHMAEPSLYEMKQIAWIVSSDPKGPVGFRPPKRERDPGDELIER